jgi:hypothetical protein
MWEIKANGCEQNALIPASPALEGLSRTLSQLDKLYPFNRNEKIKINNVTNNIKVKINFIFVSLKFTITNYKKDNYI